MTKKTTLKTIAYLRVSTNDQDLDKNKADILHLANDHNLGKVIFVEEKVSGKVSWKERKLKEVLEDLTIGDSLIVSELSRLGRSMLECMEILSIATQREIKVYSVKGNWQLDGSLQSKVVAMAFSIAAEIERDLISSRTKEALRHRKASGQSLGRPRGAGKSRLDQYRPEIESFLKNGSTKTFIAKRYGVNKATLHNWITKHSLR
jgi:DNA invertase Pin-like site-specific DNA recombinase